MTDPEFQDPWWIWLLVGGSVVAALLAILVNVAVTKRSDDQE